MTRRTRTPESLWRTIRKSTVQRGDHLIWTGTTSQGFTKIAHHINDNGSMITRNAARVIWELTNGEAPTEHWLRSKASCDEPLCVNPAHYYLHDTTAPKPAPERKAPLTLAERIERRTQRNADGCLIWTGSRDSDGYPKIILTEGEKRRQRPVHHVYWELVNGQLPEGCELARHPDCENRRCIEPLHLQLNTKRGQAGGTAANWGHERGTNFACGHARDSEHAEQHQPGKYRCGTCHKTRAQERCRRWRERHPDKVRAYYTRRKEMELAA
jgi:hypothetical protein